VPRRSIVNRPSVPSSSDDPRSAEAEGVGVGDAEGDGDAEGTGDGDGDGEANATAGGDAAGAPRLFTTTMPATIATITTPAAPMAAQER
jgi:hypothetical protein